MASEVTEKPRLFLFLCCNIFWCWLRLSCFLLYDYRMSAASLGMTSKFQARKSEVGKGQVTCLCVFFLIREAKSSRSTNLHIIDKKWVTWPLLATGVSGKWIILSFPIFVIESRRGLYLSNSWAKLQCLPHWPILCLEDQKVLLLQSGLWV